MSEIVFQSDSGLPPAPESESDEEVVEVAESLEKVDVSKEKDKSKKKKKKKKLLPGMEATEKEGDAEKGVAEGEEDPDFVVEAQALRNSNCRFYEDPYPEVRGCLFV